jgi:hypothetical protein
MTTSRPAASAMTTSRPAASVVITSRPAASVVTTRIVRFSGGTEVGSVCCNPDWPDR